MSAVLFLLAALAAAYLLWPLFRRGRTAPADAAPAGPADAGRADAETEAATEGRGGATRAVWLIITATLGLVAARPAHALSDDVHVGLLLIAVDAQRDHLRISEALRVANPGPARVLDLAVTLPPGAQYLTFHRGLVHPAPTAGGFRDRLMVGRGVTEVIYSYALPSGSALRLLRAFPLPVARLEIAVRGRGVRLDASRGRRAGDLTVGGEAVARWEVGRLDAGETIVLALSGLPVSRPWVAPAAALLLAVMLAGGLFASRVPRGRGRREAAGVEE